MEIENFQELVLQTLAKLSEGQKSLEAGQQEINNEIKVIRESQVRFEQEITDKVRALYDAREVQADVNAKILSTLERIEAKVDVLQMETSSIRRIK